MQSISLNPLEPTARSHVLKQQWLVCNGLGGYASGTLSGALTWRYHGLLVAALPAPLGRTVMLNHLTEYLERPDGTVETLSGAETDDSEAMAAARSLTEFWLEDHLPVWRFRSGDLVLEKRILMPYLQNSVHLRYTLRSPEPGIRLRLRPALHFRPFEQDVGGSIPEDYEIRLLGPRYEIRAPGRFPPLRLLIDARESAFTSEGGRMTDVNYDRDAERGYDSRGQLWSPGYFSLGLNSAEPVTLVASTEEWHTLTALNPADALSTERQRRQRLLRLAHADAADDTTVNLVLAADQFVISPIGRVADAARARASGDEIRSVVAGYHWFTDWGRDTMISLEGLTMTTGRHHEAAWILRTFAHYVRDGLIPNLFPEGRNEGLYHTADATLWFFHAVHRYVEITGDRETLVGLLPVLRDIIEHHLQGTRFGIHVDPKDSLLVQGEQGYQLTWMDAKVDDWVVTPRRGKAVEINALWYNALCLMMGWLKEQDAKAATPALQEHAERAKESFNARFWNAATGCLFDVVDGEQGDDPAVRPNQVFAISLSHPVLARERWSAVMKVVEQDLLTPRGLRSLSPSHPDFKSTYTGDLRARDASYHQGTVWAWLIGPFIDAWLKVHPKDPARARRFLEGFEAQLGEGCIGSISEVFDAEPPFTERGCIAQAWSVAEVLRCLALTRER
jgi:predicted glycogen debranching enzyme